ncbi:Uncharacterized protein TCM_016337 [Theobroma cacao]|uniref:Cleavage stimulation factor 50 kDa subunit n=1 Tax=Theobroma cacao TaxID=3641 RepID=A0A061GCR6_THECC|nr:Uncharacterized protein TCM_016337 [Theobroma cacao]
MIIQQHTCTIDVNTFQCYLSASPPEIGVNGAIYHVRYSSTGSMYVTASKDGAIRLWDGISHSWCTWSSRGHKCMFYEGSKNKKLYMLFVILLNGENMSCQKNIYNLLKHQFYLEKIDPVAINISPTTVPVPKIGTRSLNSTMRFL